MLRGDRMRARLAGHPLHPLFVHFPAALWPASLLWDALGGWRGEALWWQMSYWSLALGSIMAIPALVTGFLEYLGLPPDARAMQAATAHMLVMLTTTSAFVASWLLRSGTAGAAPPLLAVGLSLAGLLLLLVGGWLGGTLVYRYGVGRPDDR